MLYQINFLPSEASMSFLNLFEFLSWNLLENLIEETEDTRIVREFAEILDANEAYENSVRLLKLIFLLHSTLATILFMKIGNLITLMLFRV